MTGMITAERLIGQRLAGVYLLEDVIASGSTSFIFRAINERLDQPVAVKVLYGSFTDNASLMARFEVEAKVQAKLNHPHIVKVFDFVADTETYAIVMELVEGVVLDQVLYELTEPMKIGRVRALMDPIFDALDFAHSRGIVHRDIKPSNIIISDVGGREYPLIMDFGIAKVLAEGPSQTAPGAMLGTLLFMSPEQCKALKTVDKRADVYSLGVTLYQMTTGMVPFYADSAFEIMLAHVQTSPTPPREFIPDMEPELEALILRALEKEPAARFSDVREMRDALAMVPGADPGGFGGSGRGSGPSGPYRLSDEAQLAIDKSERSFPTGDHQRAPSLDSAALSAPAVASGTQNARSLRARGGPETGPKRLAAEARRGRQKPSDADPPQSVESRGPIRGGGAQGESVPTVSSRGERAPMRGDKLAVAKERFAERKVSTRRFGSPAAPSSRREAASAGADRKKAGRQAPARTPEVLSGQTPVSQGVCLRLRIPAKADWGRFFDPNIAGGGIFCPTSQPPEVGAPIRLEIIFVKGPRFFVRGAVTWRRPQLNDPRARAGVGVQVHPSERNKLAYVHSWVHGKVDDKRLLRRLPVKLRVTYSARSGRRINFTRDLNEHGLFVRSRELLDLNTQISVILMPPVGNKPFPLRGVVSRQVEDPEDRGMGIRLTFVDDTERAGFAAFVESLEKQYLAGTLPDEAVA